MSRNNIGTNMPRGRVPRAATQTAGGIRPWASLAVFVVCAVASETDLETDFSPVTCGSIIKLKHAATGYETRPVRLRVCRLTNVSPAIDCTHTISSSAVDPASSPSGFSSWGILTSNSSPPQPALLGRYVIVSVCTPLRWLLPCRKATTITRYGSSNLATQPLSARAARP